MIASLMSWFRDRSKSFNLANDDAGSVAKKRLSILLLQDRIQLPPPQMEALKNDLLEVIARYVEVDNSAVEISFEKVADSRQMALMTNIPVKRVFEGEEPTPSAG